MRRTMGSLNYMVQELVGLGCLEEALEQITDFTKDEIYEWIENLYESDLFDLIHDAVDIDIHEMVSLDYVYSGYTPTQVLEELSEIDTSDAYFSEYSRESNDDIWELINEDQREVAEGLYSRDIRFCNGDLDEIFAQEQWLVEKVKERYLIYDKARELFEMALDENPQEVLTALWNMKAEA